jgi:hypothetical protein
MYKPIAGIFVERISYLFKDLGLSTPCSFAFLQDRVVPMLDRPTKLILIR